MLRGVLPTRTAFPGRRKDIAVAADESSGVERAVGAPPMGLSARRGEARL